MGPDILETEEHTMDGSLDNVQRRDHEQQEKLQKRLAQRQLPQRGEALTGLLGELDSALDDLQVILGPVLAPAGPAMALLTDQQDPQSELAGLLQGLSGRLQRAVHFARDLADRVDL